MVEVIKTTFQLRRGEASVWKKNNPILAKGEPGVELDTLKMKIGDGATPWNLQFIQRNSMQSQQPVLLQFVW